MTAKFKVLVERHHVRLDLSLFGDFDGSSAYTLLNVIVKNIVRYNNIVINTNGLKCVQDYGVQVFAANLKRVTQRHKPPSITGRFKERFQQEGAMDFSMPGLDLNR